MGATDEREVWLVRHGETEWSRDGKHTSHTDLELTDPGIEVARELAGRLADHSFSLVLTSPKRRAVHTAALAGFADAEHDDDLVEWDYGSYEGITTDEIRRTVPDWSVWTHPCPGGEDAEQVGARLDRVIARAHSADGDVLVFGHGHSLRGLAARWIQQPVDEGRFLKLETATVSVLAYEREHPVILRWNS